MTGDRPWDALPADVIDRFARDWRAVAGAEHAAPVLVALSGGPDSVALLLLFAALGLGRVQAATVDHGLRAESAEEALAAGALARRCDVEHVVLGGALPPARSGAANLSARARAFRYRLLDERAAAIGARWIVTAHHADDQLETLVMRLRRGAGLRGMAGVRARRGRVARPLLGWRRAELAEIAARCGVIPAADPANVDDRYDRARLRKALAGVDWLDAVAAARSAAALAEAEEAIGWVVERLAGERCVAHETGVRLDASGLPAEFARRLVERCLRLVEPTAAPRGEAIGVALDRLAAGGGGTLAGVRYAVDGDGRWTFRRAPPRREN